MRTGPLRTPRRRLIAATLALALVTAACGSGDSAGEDTIPTSDGKVTVVATTTVLGDVVRNVVGDDAEVVVLMPIGADPHDFRASSAQVAAMNDADLVVANGLGLEEGLDDVLDAAIEDGVRVLKVAPLLEPLPFAEEAHGGHDDEDGHDDDHSDDHDDDHSDDHSDDHDAEDGHDHDGDDPHVWFDLTRMATAAEAIAAELRIVDPSTNWSADAYAAELRAADSEIEAILSAVEQRKLVTSHDSLGYFAARYDFEVVGTVIPGGSTVASPSSEELAGLVTIMQQEQVSVVFAETTSPQQLADAVAAELGSSAQVVSLYTGSLGEPGSGADTLIGMVRTNADLIADALSG